MTTRAFVSFLAIALLCSCASFKRRPPDQMNLGNIPHEEGDNNPDRDAPPPLSASVPAPAPKKKNPYLNLTGYLMRPPLFVNAADQSKFQRCLPITIEQVQLHKGYARIFVRQGEHRFGISGINRKMLQQKGVRLPLVDKYFMKKLDINGSGRAIAVANNKLCEGQFAQKMPKKEFLFLSGDPDAVKKGTSSAGAIEELIYKGAGSAPGMTYYFLAGQLYSWKN